ncbi:MAG: RNA 2'-phosphotransferase [Oscillospiraceae bacterium]|nr:RNA 2'-phosphotransferase [Oscillospiraceae bacterium]
MNLTKASKFLALVLRHKPEAAGVTLDPHGWADAECLIKGMTAAGYPVDREMLEEIVRTDEKGRYAFSGDGKRIRAVQGHSVPVDVDLQETAPPEYLYHGTAERFAAQIRAEGLRPMSRLYVHLSGDIETARKVGSRHGKPYLFRIPAAEMARQGYVFYLSENGVWLTKSVPPAFLYNAEEL